ncbi:unnamed protein product [Paramecium pentaurelia]|uniref:Uncharacterized protein n=1 Tax=Paramecium pentaurelia TaxID=43138 RepID=A0A8S1U5F6_9CILI|nr:unnamed protein product [Paramecium pentaurelia]
MVTGFIGHLILFRVQLIRKLKSQSMTILKLQESIKNCKCIYIFYNRRILNQNYQQLLIQVIQYSLFMNLILDKENNYLILCTFDITIISELQMNKKQLQSIIIYEVNEFI